MRYALLVILPFGLLWAISAQSPDPKPDDKPENKAEAKERGPLSPKEELATFQIADGFQIQLAASEPDVVDPVAMAFDEFGRLYVAELRVYPNDGIAKEPDLVSRIVRLEDIDNDGVFDRSKVFADRLRIPNSIMPYDGGIIVCDAPDIIFLRDTDDDGVADVSRVLYSGFDLSNIQMLPNGLQWGLDNWIYGLAGHGGTVKYGVDGGFVPQNLKGRGLRFKPNDAESLEATSGGGQFGLTSDDFGHWFTSTNSQHLRQIVFNDRYLSRNPYLSIPATTVDIAEHGPACKVFRVSEFEAWRVERTTRRQKDPTLSKRLPSTELVPGGFITSACSPTIYRGQLFPDAYGDSFVCDPANNLIHREKLTNTGAVFLAKRAYADREFLASKDNWFRPTCTTVGPDGSLYVADFYREVIETPLSLPEDIKEKYNLDSRNTGRIWRISPKGSKYEKQQLPGKMSANELVRELSQVNSWRRMTAQRLIVEQKLKDAIEPAKKLLQTATFPPARIHALWILHSFDSLDDASIVAAMKDESPGVRAQGLILAEPRFRSSEILRDAARKLADDADKSVRFQAALSLGDCPEAVPALARIWEKDASDPWISLAILSSSKNSAIDLFASQCDKPNANEAALAKLARVAAKADRPAVIKYLADRLANAKTLPIAETMMFFDSLGGSPDTIWKELSAVNKDLKSKTELAWASAIAQLKTAKATEADRVQAIRLLSLAPSDVAMSVAPSLLQPKESKAIQLAALDLLGRLNENAATDLILKEWPGFIPEVRKSAIQILLSRADSTRRLLLSVEKGTVSAGQFDATQTAQLRSATNAEIKKLAAKVLTATNADRAKIIEQYRLALESPGDVARGKVVFAKLCSACHKLENVGHDVGANLLAALGNKTSEMLLVDIFDPSREVDVRYLQYTLDTVDGRTFTGVVASDTSTSITLRVPEKGDISILRTDIDRLVASTKSLMPEGLEKDLTKEQFADVVTYLMSLKKK